VLKLHLIIFNKNLFCLASSREQHDILPSSGIALHSLIPTQILTNLQPLMIPF